MGEDVENGTLSADGQTRTFPRAQPMVAVLLPIVRDYIGMARELGVQQLRVGDIEIVMGAETKPAPAEKRQEKPRPLSPVTGLEMTDEEMVQYGETV